MKRTIHIEDKIWNQQKKPARRSSEIVISAHRTSDCRQFQKQCIDFALNARPRSLFMPEDKNSIKYRIWRLVTSAPFEYFIMAMICCNTIILMMKFHGNSDFYEKVLRYATVVHGSCRY